MRHSLILKLRSVGWLVGWMGPTTLVLHLPLVDQLCTTMRTRGWIFDFLVQTQNQLPDLFWEYAKMVWWTRIFRPPRRISSVLRPLLRSSARPSVRSTPYPISQAINDPKQKIQTIQDPTQPHDRGFFIFGSRTMSDPPTPTAPRRRRRIRQGGSELLLLKQPLSAGQQSHHHPWEEKRTRPPPKPEQLVATTDGSCPGILAETLRRALEEMVEPGADDQEEEDRQSCRSVPPPPLLATTMIPCLFKALSEAWVPCQSEPCRPIDAPTTHSTAAAAAGAAFHPSTNNQAAPAAAVLRGRLAHFNRVGSKWRMVVEQAQLVQKTAPATTIITTTRSLVSKVHGRSSTPTPSSSSSVVVLATIPRLELLLTNDRIE